MTKKRKKIIGFSTLGVVVAASVVTPLLILNNSNANWRSHGDGVYEEKTISKSYKIPVIRESLAGMEYNPTRFDELIQERKSSIVKTKTDDGLTTYSIGLCVIRLEKGAVDILNKYLSSSEIDDLVASIFANLNFSLDQVKDTASIWFTTNDNPIDADILAKQVGSDIRLFLNDFETSLWKMHNKVDFSVVKHTILDNIYHEFSHVMHSSYGNSRSAVHGEFPTTLAKVHDTTGDKNIKPTFLNPFKNVLYSLGMQDVFEKIFKQTIHGSAQVIEAISKGDSLLDPQEIANTASRYYGPASEISQHFNEIMYAAREGRGMGGFEGAYMGVAVFTEVFARLQHYNTIYDNFDELFYPSLAISEQLATGSETGINPYPKDTTFSAKFMEQVFKYFLGFGDMNTVWIENKGPNTDGIWFGSTGTELGKKVKVARFVYPDGNVDVPIQSKEFPISWNYLPFTMNERYYKYVAHSNYGYVTTPHHETMPQQVIFLDKDNNVLSNDNIQIIHNEKVNEFPVNARYIYNDQTSSWSENYDNT